jgi:putative peptide zinc metalloprotease protein
MSETRSKPIDQNAANAICPSLRRDLQWVHYPDQVQWVAYDPIGGGYFRFNEFEYFAAHNMDGTRSIGEIVSSSNRRFAARDIDLAWITNFIQRLQTSFLLQSSKQSSRWIASRCTSGSPGFLGQAMLNPLSIRVPLFDPAGLLKSTRWLANLLFHRIVISLAMLLALACSVLVFRELFRNAAVLEVDPTRITADRWVLLLLCIIVAKSLHELGHMLACAKYGVRSSEVGLLFLCLTPCFYCETTDAWRLPSKWHRAMIAAAGIYVEIILAVGGAIVWLMTNDGTLHLIAFNLMVICSISTVLVNANPLFRFDGYYILSDIWQIPNLHEQSRRAASLLFEKYVLLKRHVQFDLDGNVWLLAGFGCASAIYRTMVLIGIIWLCWSYLPSMGLGLLAIAISASLAMGILYAYWRKAKIVLRAFGRMGFGERIWTVIVLAVISSVITIAACWPLPQYVRARALVDYEDKQPIYVSYDAKITYVADSNIQCTGGGELLRLESPDAQMELVKLQGKKDRVANQLKQLRLRQAIEPDVNYTIPTLEKELSTLEARQQMLLKEIDQLVFIAPENGYLIDANLMKNRDLTQIRDDRFQQSACSQESVDCWTKRGELIGWFSPRRKALIVALVPEQSIGKLTVGMSATIRTDANVGCDLKGQITQIANNPIQKVPESLLGDETLPAMLSANGEIETEVPHYEVTIAIDQSRSMLFGAVATVSFELSVVPIYQHAIDYIRQSMKPLLL